MTVCLKVSRKDKIWQPKSFILHHIKKEVPLTKIIHRIIQRRFIHINCRRSAACPLLRPRPPPPAPSALSLPLLLPSSQPPSAADTQEQIFTNHTGNKTGKCKWKSVPDRGGLWRAARVGLRLCTGPKIRVLPGLLVLLSPSEHGS